MTKETITEWFSVQEMLPPQGEFVKVMGLSEQYSLTRNDLGEWWWSDVTYWGPTMQPTDMWAFLDDEEIEDEHD